MTRTIRVSALALAISAGWTLPAQARATNDAVAQELAAMRAQMEAMAQRIDTLEAQLTEARSRADAAQSAVAAQAAALPQQIAAAVPPAPKPTTQISWDGAPKITGEGGWSFKPRGRLHIDAGAISSPGQYESANLGSRTRVRRARLGFEGTVPGGFGYKAEADFANAGVAFGDVQVSYASSKVPLTVRVGSFESLNRFEQTGAPKLACSPAMPSTPGWTTMAGSARRGWSMRPRRWAASCTLASTSSIASSPPTSVAARPPGWGCRPPTSLPAIAPGPIRS